MKFINRLMYNKKRAVSPVIAVILLIGLAVAASAAIFIVILPLLEPTSSIDITEGYVTYDTEYTTALDEGQGYGKGLVNVMNTGTGEVEITSIKIYWATSFAGTWTEITDAVSTQGITVNDPWVSEPISGSGDELSIRFPIPTENINNSLSYKIILIPNEGRNLDTSRIDVIEETEMQLDADRPDISYTGSLDTIRTPFGSVKGVSPNSVSENSAVKNVTFEVFNTSGLVLTNVITSTSAWNWNWHTYLPSSQGLSNGSYTMKMTAYDYAGLSDFVDAGSFTIDNDYIQPNIESTIGSSIKGGIGVAEVGESYRVDANITDSGCGTSHVTSADLHYRDNDTGLLKEGNIPMFQGVGNNWYANVPAAFIDSLILTEKLSFNISATDEFLNENDSSEYYADVEDTTEPDFTAHTPVTTVTLDTTIDISATVTDEDVVDIVNLVWRHRNDTGLYTQYGSWKVSTNISGTGNTWNFQISGLNATLDGIDYYLNATDLTGNPNVQSLDGTPTSPYHIVIPDVLSPEVIIRTPIPVPDEHTAGQSLTVSVYVSDRDLTFSKMGDPSGTVELGYRAYPNSFTYAGMTHISGDSSTGGLGVWETFIPSGTFTATGFARVDFHIRATDISSNEKITTDYTISVLPGGTPIFSYITNSLTLSGTSDSFLEFDINNTAGGTNPADGTITDVQVELINRSKPASIGDPYITQINVTGGSNPIWNNGSTYGGQNGSILNLNDSFSLGKGVQTTMGIEFANSSGGYYNLMNFKVNVTLYYNYTTTGPETGSTSLLLRTPGAEPDYISATPYSYNSRYYINSWIVSPLYPYSGNWGWQTEYSAPWTTADYSLSEVANGDYFISTEVGAPTGDSATHTSSTGNDEWVYVTQNDYRMNLDTVVGGTDNHYLWLYAVVTLPPATYPNAEYTGMTVAMGSDDEAILYINGYLIAQRTTPRGWSEAGTTNTTVTLKGNGQNNYILFGVHEDGGGYQGSVGIATSVPYTIKVYNQGPPAAPMMQSIGSSRSFSSGESVSLNIKHILETKNDLGIISILEELRDSLKYCIMKLFNS